MNEEQSNYKVTDRRLFNADGTPREVPAEERPVLKPESETASAIPSASDRPAESTPAEPEPSVHASAPAPEADDSEIEIPDASDPAGFVNFLMSIAQNAAASLGMMEHPVTHKRELDLELGKHWIDVLGMLEQKTRGNLLPQEQQILEGLLADLRMQYVSLANTTPKQAKYTSQDITGG